MRAENGRDSFGDSRIHFRPPPRCSQLEPPDHLLWADSTDPSSTYVGGRPSCPHECHPDPGTRFSLFIKPISLFRRPARGRREPRVARELGLTGTSLLRDWYIPPGHLIVHKETQRCAMLDGQQRLAAIPDFMRNRFIVDGHTPPLQESRRDDIRRAPKRVQGTVHQSQDESLPPGQGPAG